MLVDSVFKGKKYNPGDTIRLLNVKQSCFYWENGCIPLDVYLSKDYTTKKPILVFVFDRKETQTTGVYDTWCKNRPED